MCASCVCAHDHLIIILHDHKRQFALLEIQTSDLGPKTVTQEGRTKYYVYKAWKEKKKKSELGPNETYQKKRPILVCPSNTRTPVGVRPRLYSLPSRACRAEVMKRQEGRRKKTHQRAHIMILSYANVAMHIPFSSCLSSRALPVWDPTCAWCVCKRYRKTVSLTFTICMSTPYISSHFALFR